MTRSITPITAASDGDNGPRTEEKAGPEHGLFVLRGREGKGLISLACDALGETFTLAHEMHARLYATDPADDRDLLQQMGEALLCSAAPAGFVTRWLVKLQVRAAGAGGRSRRA